MTKNTFAAIHHSLMLGDVTRLQKYKSALAEVLLLDDWAVDIGCGTGVLAAFATEFTRNRVIAVEAIDATALVARTALMESGFANVELMQNRSYDVELSCPTVLITETIGQIGPEKNIVELCWDFARRHPSIRSIIPSHLSVIAQFGTSKHASGRLTRLMNPFYGSDTQPLSFTSQISSVRNAFSTYHFFDDISDFQCVGNEIELASYALGESKFSSFSRAIKREPRADVLHLFFRAVLSASVILESSFRYITHWGHAHLHVPDEALCATICYSHDVNSVLVDWS